MKYCEKCKEYYKDEYEICPKCNAALVNEGAVPEKKGKKLYIILLIIFIAALISVGGYFVYTNFIQSPVDRLSADEKKIYEALLLNDDVNDDAELYSCSVVHEYGEDEAEGGGDSDGLYPTFFKDYSSQFTEYCYIEAEIDGYRDVYLLVLNGDSKGTLSTYNIMVSALKKIYEFEDFDSYQLGNALESLGYTRWYVNPSPKINPDKINDALEDYYSE